MSEQKPLVAGRYQLEQLIGRGGMGDVYRGVDTHTGETVAIKLLHETIVQENPDIVDRFTREGEALSRLDHPNIVKMLGSVEEDGKHYLIMEYVGGGSLRDLIDEKSRLPLEAVLNIALDLVDALTRAHRLNIIHRDIKPDNVLLADDGTPRLTDFGVAHMGDRTRLTQTGAVIGTYAYLSPEACNGLDLDERADIWSFGVMLFEMLTGRVPFSESGTAAILTAILTKPAPDITRLRPGIPEPLADLIARMLEKDRERRISSVRVVGTELEALIRGLDTPLRDLVQRGGQGPHLGSRFSTPQDDVPAMARSTPDQTHGLSLYPGAQPSTPPPYTPGAMVTPGGTPITAEMIPQATKWKWIALMVIVTVLACSVVIVIAILLGPQSRSDQNHQPAPTVAVSGVPEGIFPRPGGGTPLVVNPVVEPVEQGQIMVLVTQFEPLAGADPASDPARFVVNDLKMALEDTVPYSNIRVRAYPDPVTSDDQAQQIADDYGAVVIVWGIYSPEQIELDIEMGATGGFTHLQFERDLLRRTVNVHVRMTNAQRESIAPYVLNLISILQNAAGDSFGALRTGAIRDVIDVTPAEIVGSTVAANLHRAILTPDPQVALGYLKDALALDAGNPLLYIHSSIIKQREGLIDDARRDALTAGRIGPPDWSLPLLVQAAMAEDVSVLDLFNRVIAQRPDDWFPYFFRGSIYYESFGATPEAYALAKADLDMSISLKPGASFPYVFSALLALHEGRIADAGQMIHIVLTEFPDPDFMKRLIVTTFGDQTLSPYTLTLAAFTNLTLGQYTPVIEDASAGIEHFPDVGDSYLMQGVAYCSLGDFAAAETSFSGGLAAQPDFVLLYLLRADARLQQANDSGAAEDFQAVADSALAAEFAPLVQDVQSRTLTCANLFSPDNPVFNTGMRAEIAALPAEAVAAVQPIEAGEYMVLVADAEPLEGAAERDVARFVAEDLRRTFEEEIPFSGVRVRQFSAIVTSDAQARAVAQAVGADVIIWGNYTPVRVELAVQVGTMDHFRHNAFPREALERVANVRVQLTSERQESLALPVLNVFNVLSAADGDEFSTISMFMLAAGLTSSSGGEITGNSAAAHLHRALIAYDSDTARAVDELSAAISADSSNALPYSFRALAYLRTANPSGYAADLASMKRLGPENWTMPLFLGAEDNMIAALQTYQKLADLRPDDWFVFFLRGNFYYYGMNNLKQARADFEQSIALKPVTNLPHISALVIALRQGRMADAEALSRAILTEYPDPALTSRALQAVYGSSVENEFSGTFYAAGTNYGLGQYDDVVQQIQTFLDYILGQPDHEALFRQEVIALSDLYMLQGLAYCNLKDYPAALDAYTMAINYSPNYALVYVLRGQMHIQQGEPDAAAEDFTTARSKMPAPAFAVWIDASQNMAWTCADMLDYQPPE
jgi:serine/threonine protein kinase/tetratricopeptide (TPR) repeat protein